MTKCRPAFYLKENVDECKNVAFGGVKKRAIWSDVL